MKVKEFLIRLLGGITREELNKVLDTNRGVCKEWDEYREDINKYIISLLDLDSYFLEKNEYLKAHIQSKDYYYSELYKLRYGKRYFDFRPIEETEFGFRNSLGHYLRKSFSGESFEIGDMLEFFKALRKQGY
ncbi:hypothetical protein BKK52_07825 [Rodentibacter trehalosifermentans]|uniref:Uncharacterized protein n=1 Tax=Rodentibacter trehalosifermentans TaxID=1908263 RepID=A0A1V3IZR3_9PAST|nr:hypothetical protein [Rodentibacter trehalosifermentans]OOF47817.1 hypothetical protein BKK52_07825 [Rodentibacter trehalosifermentans]